MGALEQITQMRSQGIPDENIMRNLQQSGFSQPDINEAFNQASIKNAVSAGNSGEGADNSVPKPYPSQPQGNQEEEDVYVPSPPQESQGMQINQQTYSPNEAYSPYQENQSEGDYYSPGSTDTSTIIEIAEQVFSEKFQDIQNALEDISEFKTLANSRIENISERLKRLEKTFDILQVAILQKVGSYGSNLESIKKEMEMMQDSFSKTLPGLKHHTHSQGQHPTTAHKTPIVKTKKEKVKPKRKTISKVKKKK